jgi:DHA1 family bicyclomycin/chloramphenicol resistance-like MFS transporter
VCARAQLTTSLLLSVDLLDELSGVGFVGSPEIEAAFRLSHHGAAVTLFVAPQLLGLLLEPPLYALSDGRSRRPFVVGGLAAMGACALVAGLAASHAVLAVAIALSAPASGIGVNLAQATMMDAHPGERERLMARWSFMGQLGDLGTPLLFAALASVSLGWREAFLVTGSLVLVSAAALALMSFPSPARPHEREKENAPAEAGPIRSVLGSRRLLPWLAGVALCSLLDETLVAFGALHLASLGLDVPSRSLVLGAFMVGGMAGLLATGRLLRRFQPLSLLVLGGAGTSLVYAAWLASSSVPVSAALMGLTGLLAAPLYPIAQAQAYRALPGRSGLVNAAKALFAPAEMAVPFVIGLVADAVGLRAALGLLLVQPLGLLALAVRELRAARGGRQ